MTGARVLIVQAMCKQYRAPLFTRMFEELAASGIELKVAYSDPIGSHRARQDDVPLPGTYGVKIPGRAFLRGMAFWQMPLRLIQNADLVIVEHAVKHLLNYPLLLLSRLRLKKLGLWVHGGTLRHPSSPLLRPYRTWSLLAADWLFTYTSGVARDVIKAGADVGRVTALENAIDLSAFRSSLASISLQELASVRQSLRIPEDAHVALFCGSLYPGRGVDFLVAVGDQVVARDHRFHLLVIGSGPLEADLHARAATRPWLHCLGSIFGDQRALYFRLAHVCLMPYLAGLGILDAMAAGLPYLVTGAHATNPEIDYLVDGVTGLVTGDSVTRFAEALLSLLADTQRLHAMAEASRSASQQYSIECMSANFCQGIRTCLGSESQL